MSKGLQDFKRWKACERKVRHQTEAAAAATGQRYYQCPYCRKWHCTASFDKLVGYLHHKAERRRNALVGS